MKFSIESIMCQCNIPIQDGSGTYRSIDEIGRVGLGRSAVGCKGDLSPIPCFPPSCRCPPDVGQTRNDWTDATILARWLRQAGLNRK